MGPSFRLPSLRDKATGGEGIGLSRRWTPDLKRKPAATAFVWCHRLVSSFLCSRCNKVSTWTPFFMRAAGASVVQIMSSWGPLKKRLEVSEKFHKLTTIINHPYSWKQAKSNDKQTIRSISKTTIFRGDQSKPDIARWPLSVRRIFHGLWPRLRGRVVTIFFVVRAHLWRRHGYERHGAPHDVRGNEIWKRYMTLYDHWYFYDF